MNHRQALTSLSSLRFYVRNRKLSPGQAYRRTVSSREPMLSHRFFVQSGTSYSCQLRRNLQCMNIVPLFRLQRSNISYFLCNAEYSSCYIVVLDVQPPAAPADLTRFTKSLSYTFPCDQIILSLSLSSIEPILYVA